MTVYICTIVRFRCFEMCILRSQFCWCYVILRRLLKTQSHSANDTRPENNHHYFDPHRSIRLCNIRQHTIFTNSYMHLTYCWNDYKRLARICHQARRRCFLSLSLSFFFLSNVTSVHRECCLLATVYLVHCGRLDVEDRKCRNYFWNVFFAAPCWRNALLQTQIIK